MENNYWLVINALRGAVNGRANRNEIAEARLRLSMALDHNLPTDEINRLIGALNELSDNIEER